MRFFIDLDTLKLVTSAADNREVTQVEAKRGDAAPFDITFLRSGVAESLAVDSVLTFGAKPSGAYDTDAVVLHSDFTEATSIYSGSPSFSTAALDALFSIDLLTSNDPAYVDLMAEFTWRVGAGAPTTSRTFIFRVHNDVIRGDETPPAYITAGTPVNATYGLAEVEVDSLPGNGDTMILTVGAGVETWTFKTTPTDVSHIQIEGTLTAQADAITAALGSEFVSCSNVGNLLTMTASTIGTAGDFTITGTAVSHHLLVTHYAAINSTSGRLGSEYIDATHLYKVASVTSGVPLWRKLAHAPL